MTRFGTELARLMGERAIGVRALAKDSGYSKTYICQLRLGQRDPSPVVARDLDDALEAKGRLAALAPEKSPAQRAKPTNGNKRAVESVHYGTLPAEVTADTDTVDVPYRDSKGRIIYVTVPRRVFLASTGLAAFAAAVPGTDYSVGAVIVDKDGNEVARGWSREDDPHVHAEESALSKVAPDDPRLIGATIYSTLEPCSERKSRPVACTQLIINSRIRRVITAWREPSLFVADCQGIELLKQAGAEIVEMPEFADAAMAPNRHLKL